MTTTCKFRVADFLFSVCLPERMDVGKLLPSFRPFRVREDESGETLFDFTLAAPETIPAADTRNLLEEIENDMGLLRLFALPDGYRVEVTQNGHTHRMWASPDFTSARASLQWEDERAGQALSSLLRIAYAQSVLGRNAVSIHAAAVSCQGRAYLFLGKSGTGKSTHAALWCRHIPDCRLLNDDNPTVRLLRGQAYAYGTPWSGKTACYKNLSFPIGGMVRLNQASANRFCRVAGAEAFIALYPGCSVIAEDTRLRNQLYDTLTGLAGAVPVTGTLECLPDREAALLCHRALAGEHTKTETSTLWNL